MKDILYIIIFQSCSFKTWKFSIIMKIVIKLGSKKYIFKNHLKAHYMKIIITDIFEGRSVCIGLYSVNSQ
jgi:hypothetical protein